jgi:hypothetical protein
MKNSKQYNTESGMKYTTSPHFIIHNLSLVTISRMNNRELKKCFFYKYVNPGFYPLKRHSVGAHA